MSILKRMILRPGRKLFRRSRINRLVNALAGFPTLEGEALTYNQDGLATVHNCDFIQEPRFAEAYKLGKATGSWGNSEVHWRAYVVCWAAARGATLAGDFVECGVNRGGFARAVIQYTDFPSSGKTFWLLDTFEGLDERLISERERKLGIWQGGYEPCYEAVKETFQPFNVRIIKGTVPDTLHEVNTQQVAFLSIDMNNAAPEIATAEFFWPKLSSGAAIVLDDYGWPLHLEQKKAFDQFAAARGVLVLPLPSGQGLIIKP